MHKQQSDAATEAVMRQPNSDQDRDRARASRPSGKQTLLITGLALTGFGVGVAIGASSDNMLTFGIVGMVLGMLIGTFAAGRRR